MKKVGVVLAGCGYLDGAEIQEAVATLLALEKRGFEVVAMAPNIPQMHVVNHRTNEVAEYTRNVFIESSRITRGEILELGEVDGRLWMPWFFLVGLVRRRISVILPFPARR